MQLRTQKLPVEDEDIRDLFDPFSYNRTEHSMVEPLFVPKVEACFSFSMKQDENFKGKEICPDEDAGIDEGTTQMVTDNYILASDECTDNPESSLDNKDEKEDAFKQVEIRRKDTGWKGNTSQETKPHHAKSDVPSTINYALAVVLLLTNGRPLVVKPSKKAFLLIVSILFALRPVAATPVQQNHETPGLYEYKLLHTSTCNYADFIRSGTCKRNEAMMDIYIRYCGFADICDSGFKPICVYTADGEMLHICSPKSLVCPKGDWRRVSRKATDSSVVIVQEEKCPKGRYQPYESDCYEACTARHDDIKDLPVQYAIYSKGDNVSPPMIYCDFKRGFYSLDGKFLQKYDEEIRYQPLECTTVTDQNPCSRGLYPIPNGTCLFPCEKGFERDVHDDFKCKEIKWAETDSSKEELNPKDNDSSQKAEEVTEISELNRTSQLMNETKTEDNRASNDSHVTIVIVFVFAALLLAIVGLAFVLLEH
ncbi:uncharacterized protein LOC123538664 isoform X2 [Mercenaria mercenaria]|uniref:uncharacterized protein LOC123538664 isoform X2 n=1 Tax=Mercenaria mercenaria TaxID=6596 RepID=UPI00234F0A57|nr:uncharacterized protein LOC123538664 isoform X2 [Mercenaria mercenaria]